MFGMAVLNFTGSPEHRAFIELSPGGGNNFRMGMSVNQRGIIVEHIDILIAVGIIKLAAFTPDHIGGIGLVIGGRAGIAAGKTKSGPGVVFT